MTGGHGPPEPSVLDLLDRAALTERRFVHARDARRQAVRAAIAGGASYRQVAAATGRPVSQVHRMVNHEYQEGR